ncbi:oligosaccharide flippase family protein [Candidatus Roizmanbacteria bacterium]|nr:oligosaccharide flippase family protein [Candidatus Roizmanbacteria bacterium]
MEKNITHTELKKRSLISILSLFFQGGYSALLGLVANIVLTVLLTPHVFGIYITVLSIIAVLNYFSDIGLAASLIQKKELKEEDIRTTFTVQQVMIICVISIGFFITPFVQSFYKLPNEGAVLYHALLIAFFISSLKTIPSVFLERKIQFQKIVMVQIVENTCFYFTVTVAAILGLGLNSFTIGVLLRAITGLIVIYSLSFWVPKIGIHRPTLKTLLAFGLPFQASSFLALFKDDLITLFLSKVVGFEGVGYIGWAKKWAEAPVRIIMDNISRVLFPVISRIQDNTQQLANLIEKTLFYQTLLLAPALVGLVVTMTPLVYIIPKYAKWAPALPLFYIFCLSALFASYSTPFINLFNALGKVKISFFFMLFWTVAIWILTPLLTHYFGYYGLPFTQVLLSSTFIAVIYAAKKYVKFSYFRSVYQPLISSAIMGCSMYGYMALFSPTFFSLVSGGVVGAVVYYYSLRLLFKIDLVKQLPVLLKHE